MPEITGKIRNEIVFPGSVKAAGTRISMSILPAEVFKNRTIAGNLRYPAGKFRNNFPVS
jgi:hypothetical protein